MAENDFTRATDDQVLTDGPPPTPEAFLKTLWGEIPPGKVLIWTLPDKKSRWYPHFENITADMRFHEYEDVYMGVGLAPKEGMRLASNKRLREWEVAAITAFWADIDVAHEVHKKSEQLPPSIERAMEAIAKLPFEATIIVNSGHGLQLWWVLKEIWLFADAEEREQARRACQWWHRLVKETFAQFGWTVDSTFDLPRVMRLPGTWNNKNPQERKRVEVTGGSGTRYGRELFTQLVPEDFKATPMGARRGRGGNGNNGGTTTGSSGIVLDPGAQPSSTRLETLLKLEPKFRATWEKRRPDLSDQSASAYDMALANFAVKAKWPDQEVANLLIAFRREHDLDLKLREKYYAVTIGKAHEPMDRNAVSTRGPDTPVPTATTLDPLRPENFKPGVPTEIIGTAKRDITTFRGGRGHNARIKSVQHAVEGSQTETLGRMLAHAHAVGDTDMTPYAEAARSNGLDEDDIQRALVSAEKSRAAAWAARGETGRETDGEVTLESLTRPSRETATEAANATRFLVDHSHLLVVAYDQNDLLPTDVYAYTEQGTISVGPLEGMLLETSGRHMDLVSALPKDTPGRSEIVRHAQRFDNTLRLPVVIANVRGAIARLRRAGLLPDSLVIKNRRDINANLRYLGAPNGVIDLHTGLVLPPDEARVTFTAAQITDDYNPEATHPDVDVIMPEVPATLEMEWWYRARGYMFARPPAKQVIVMLTPPDSGKTVFANCDMDSFGLQYVSSIRPQTLQQSDYSGPTTYNDGLLSFGNGMRVLYQSEAKGNQDAGLINLVTGGERSFPARGIKEKEVRVTASAHLIMQSNVPETGTPELRFGVASTSDSSEASALRGRMYMLPMPQIPKDQRNAAYLSISAHNVEGSAKFRQAWVARTIRQCVAMAGQPWPDRLESQAAALDELQQRETDPWVSEWLERVLVTAAGGEVHSRQIYADYEDWHEENGGTKKAQRAVTDAVIARYGPGKPEQFVPWNGKRAKVVLWQGWALRSQQEGG